MQKYSGGSVFSLVSKSLVKVLVSVWPLLKPFRVLTNILERETVYTMFITATFVITNQLLLQNSKHM